MRIFNTLVALLATTTVAAAHTETGAAHGFLHGFEHPLGGLDHVLAMVAVGLLAALIGGRALWLVPLSFITTMAAGSVIGVAGVSLPFVEIGIALSIVVVGGAIALGRQLPVAAAIGLVGTFAVFHGHAHGAEMPAGISGLSYGAGFLVGTGLLHAAGLVIGLSAAQLSTTNGPRAARIGGAAISLAGIAILAGIL